MTRVSAVLASAFLVGCATVQPVPREPVSTNSQHKFEKNYSLGSESQAYVGQPIVRVKDYWELTSSGGALVADRAATLRLPPFITADIAKDSTATVVGTTTRDNKTFRVITIPASAAAALRFLLNDDGTFQGSAINFMGERMGFSYTPDPPDLHFVSKTVAQRDTTKGWTNFELVYSGASKDAINLLYREYTPDDLAKPAFTQSLTYDRSSTAIRFRELQIEVKDANNESIRYIVKADGL